MRTSKTILTFLANQILSTLGVMVGAALIVFFLVSVVHHWQPAADNATASRILVGSPFFPVQTLLAFVLGTLMVKRFKQPAMFWVWALPAAILLCAMLFGPIAQVRESGHYNPISHFFGTACRPENGCFDQIAFTLPLYSAAAYSLGAFAAGRMRLRTITEM